MPKYKYYFAISDFSILTVSFFASTYFLTSLENYESGLLIQIMILFAVLSSMVIFIFERNQLYSAEVILKRKQHITALTKSLLFASAITLIVFMLFYLDSLNVLGTITLISVFSASVLFYMLRVGLYKKVITKVRKDLILKNVMIIGAGKSGTVIARELMNEKSSDINVVGFLDDFKSPGLDIILGKRVLGKIEQIREMVDKYFVDEAILAIDSLSYERLLDIMDFCRILRVKLKISSRHFEKIRRNFSKEIYGGLPVINISPSSIRNVRGIKRIIDFTGALTAIMILSPILILIALLIKITSPGPVIFRQNRIGHNGKPFVFYKFRSMYVISGEDEDRKKMMIDFMKKNKVIAEDKKVINDSRVTWIGKYIRKTSLDELPQLFNVLKGDMSLVGPRPCLPYEYDNYDVWQKRRVDVLPGCTGVWQVSGRSEVSFNDSVLMDIYYINNLSLFFDLRILLKTFPVMFFSKGGR